MRLQFYLRFIYYKLPKQIKRDSRACDQLSRAQDYHFRQEQTSSSNSEGKSSIDGDQTQLSDDDLATRKDSFISMASTTKIRSRRIEEK